MALRIPDNIVLPSVAPQTQPAPEMRINAPAGAFGADVAQATEQVGAKLENVGDMLAKHAVQFQMLNNETMAKDADVAAVGKLSDAWINYEKLKGKAALDAYPDFVKQLHGVRKEMGDSLPNAQARKLFDDSFVRRLDYMQNSAARYAAQQRDKWMLDASKARSDISIDQAVLFRDNPDQVQLHVNTGVEEIREQGRMLGQDPDTIQDRVSDYQGKAYRTVIGAVATNDIGAAKKLYEAVKPNLGGVARATIEADLARAREEGLAAFRGDVNRRFDDNIASANDTGQFSMPLSPEEIRHAYPKDPSRAEYMIRQLNGSLDVGRAFQTMAMQSPQEDQATIDRFLPQRGSPDYSSQVGRYNSVVKAYSDKLRAIDKDPSAYVVGNSPAVRDLFSQAKTNPAMLPTAVGALDATYDKLGVPEWNRPLLTNAAAASEVNRILSAPPEERANRLKQMAEGYGPLWPRVMGDLVGAKLPPEYQVLAAVDDSTSRIALADAIGTGKKKLADAIPKDDKKSIDDRIESSTEMKNLRASMGYASDGLETFAGIEGAVKLMAYRHAGTMDADAAAKKAIQAVTTDKYDFTDTARTPKGRLGQVRSTADQILADLKPADLTPQAGGADLTDEQRNEITLSAARRGKWVTNESDDGWVRLDVIGRPVIMKGGKRLEVKFKDAAMQTNPEPGGVPQ